MLLWIVYGVKNKKKSLVHNKIFKAMIKHKKKSKALAQITDRCLAGNSNWYLLLQSLMLRL